MPRHIVWWYMHVPLPNKKFFVSLVIQILLLKWHKVADFRLCAILTIVTPTPEVGVNCTNVNCGATCTPKESPY